MSVSKLFPDFGAPETKMIGGVPCVNGAGVIEIAKRAGTPQSRRFLKVLAAVSRDLDRRQYLSQAEKQRQAIEAAIRACGFNPVSMGEET